MFDIGKTGRRALLLVMAVTLFIGGGCSREAEPLLVYAGKGLKNAMEEIKRTFEDREGIPLSMVYAGSNTLLATLQRSLKGDVFVPGSQSYIKKAGKLITAHHPVAVHVPGFTARADNPRNLRAFGDLLAPGVRIAVCNKDMAAIGRVTEAILHTAGPRHSFRHNIVVTASTVNELLQLVLDGEVDAALVWSDMLRWRESHELVDIPIPDEINTPKEIRVGVLSTSGNPQQATAFADFMVKQGRDIFLKHGFGKN